MADGALTELQVQVLRLFFSLPRSEGFVLAGGAALIASRLSERRTQDLDLFTSGGADDIVSAADDFEDACVDQGWSITRIQDTPTFRRMVVHGGDDDLLVDIAVDSPPAGALVSTEYGPTYRPEELAARKLLALFDRAAARDFVDVSALSSQFDLEQLLGMASRIDEGFDRGVLAEMLTTVDRFSDQELSDLGADAEAVRAVAARWHDHLAADSD